MLCFRAYPLLGALFSLSVGSFLDICPFACHSLCRRNRSTHQNSSVKYHCISYNLRCLYLCTYTHPGTDSLCISAQIHYLLGAPRRSIPPILLPTRLPSYLELVNAQAAAQTACGSDHMCLVGVWAVQENIVQMLQDLVRNANTHGVASQKILGPCCPFALLL